MARKPYSATQSVYDVHMGYRDEECEEAPKCRHCHGNGCDACQGTGYAGGREP